MTTVVILNVLLATLVLMGVVGALSYAIVRDGSWRRGLPGPGEWYSGPAHRAA